MSRLTAQGRRASSEILEAPKRHEGRAIADAATVGADLIVMGSREGQGWLASCSAAWRAVSSTVLPALMAR